MPAIAMGLAWAGYTLGLWGYCLLRGYDVTLRQLASPLHPVTWARASGSRIPDGQVFPSGGDSAAEGGVPGPITGPRPQAV